ncbi:MAG: hypothetical protein ACJAS1_005143 [Oleiphilaceae bacterium]|jgi:hypothetical protein
MISFIFTLVFTIVGWNYSDGIAINIAFFISDIFSIDGLFVAFFYLAVHIFLTAICFFIGFSIDRKMGL